MVNDNGLLGPAKYDNTVNVCPTLPLNRDETAHEPKYANMLTLNPGHYATCCA